MMQPIFYALAKFLDTRLRGAEQYTCWFSAEASDFVRFNRSAIRQPGHVRQIVLSLTLIDGQRHATGELSLSGETGADRALIEHAIGQLRAQLPSLPPDPHLLIATEVHSTEHIAPSRLPPAGVMVDQMLAAAQGYDMVGILTAGPVYRGFANSFGQRNWHETASFNADWSLYLARDKAVKSAYAGFDWDETAFRGRFERAAAQLQMLKRDPVTIRPGNYRVYLAPAALNDIIGMLNWDGLSEKALRTKRSSLRRMRDDGLCLNSAVTLENDNAGGLAPAFQREGFIKPARTSLLQHGRLTGSMVAPRTAREYGIEANGAEGEEDAASLELATGDLLQADVLRALDTGILVSNLWYLNFSDRPNCRLTGMTRFASFWVENGEIVAPLNVMRFDDTLFRMLGDNLLGLTQERELLIDGETYGERRTAGALVPGALVRNVAFVL
jgi:predicted Zn-dependent protease